jgi:fructose-specific phosphotransferase system IIC component
MLQETPVKYDPEQFEDSLDERPRANKRFRVGVGVGLALMVTPIVAGFWPSHHMPPARALADGCAANHYMAYHQNSSCSWDGSHLRQFVGGALVGGVAGGLAGPEGIVPGMIGGMLSQVPR